MGTLSAQAVLTFIVWTAIVFVIGVLVGIFVRPDEERPHAGGQLSGPFPTPASRDAAMKHGAEVARHLRIVGTRRLRAGPLRDSLDDACEPSRPR